MSQQEIKDLKAEWAERPVNKMIGKPPIRFVPTETEYDNPEKTNVFFISFNLDLSTIAKKEDVRRSGRGRK